MKLMIQIPVTRTAAGKFISQMESQGYKAHRAADRDREDVHFTLGGETTSDYAVTSVRGENGRMKTYIGIRPA